MARSNLPAEVSSFVGRRHELTEAKRLLETHRLVTLTGPGGVGKTRLGLRVAAQVRRAFPDGVFLVDLTTLEDHLLLGDTVLHALGIIDRSARSAQDVLVEHLADRRTLLVLDNCEHLVDACTWLVDTLLRAAPDLRVLATSREPLRVLGQSVLEVAPARPDDAIELFEQRARAVLPGFAVTESNRDLVAGLCQRVDSLPLAIELAAARLRVLSIEQVRDRLADRFRLLSAPGAAGRHGSMQATVEWSVQSCSKPERVLWARLSVFAGDFELEAAEYVGTGDKVSRHEILDLVAGLVDKSILITRRDGPVVRYGWLETLREYGRRLLAERGEEVGLSVEEAAGLALGDPPARAATAPRPAGRSPLTPREREVVALVARGLSDNEIAAELVIARRTAESHVQHILRKLGFTTRAQIAAWSSQQDRLL
jgi:predicted ATPase